MNSPNKFVDPLGLISEPTGACGSRCQNSGLTVDGSAMRGRDSTFDSLFEALALAPFSSAIEESIEWAQNAGLNDRIQILRGFQNILNFGNAQSKQIATTLLTSNVTFPVLPTASLGTSGTTGLTDVAGANAAIAAGNLTVVKDALSFITITIAREELNNDASLEVNIVHEGMHSIIQATVLSSLSTENPKKYQNETETNGEIRATTAAAQYLKDRGGAHVTYGKHPQVKLIDSNGNVNTSFIKSKSQGSGNVLRYFKSPGVQWKQMWASY